MDNLTKYPEEEFKVSVDFAKSMDTEDTIDAGNSSVTALLNDTDVTGTLITPGSLTVNGKKLLAEITGGSDGNSYKVKFLCHTTGGEKFRHDVYINVKD